MNRREFIQSAAVTSAGLFLSSCGMPIIPPRKFGPNDKINVAQIGFGRIAHYDLGETMKNDGCRVVAVADVDITRAKDGKKFIEKKNPYEFGHTLADQIQGQIEAGFVITGFYEDKGEPSLDRLTAIFLATRAEKLAPR
jgi:hypothetical protein